MMHPLLEALGLDSPGIGHNGGPALDAEPPAPSVLDLLLELCAPGERSSKRGPEDLRFYQNFMVDKIIELDALLLAAEMGLGKTVAVLTALARMFAAGTARRVLIIAPLRVASDTWPDEIAAWRHTEHLTWTLIRAEDDDEEVVAGYKAAYQQARAEGKSPKEAQRLGGLARTATKELIRRRQAQQNTQIHIINREAIPWLVKRWGRLWPYDVIVYDEASRLKAGSKRTKPTKRKDGTVSSGRNLSEFGSLARVRGFSKKVIELSGTPAPNGLRDMWGPFYILDQGYRLGASKTAFMNRWFDVGRYDYSITPKPHAHAEITAAVSDIMISLKEADYLTLPPRIDNPVRVKLPRELMEKYRRFERDMVLAEYDVEAVSSGVLTNKLLQFANGSLYLPKGPEFDFETRDVVHLHDLKLEALESIVEEAQGEPVLLAYSFRFDLERITKRFPKAVIFGKDRDAVKKWNAGKIPLLLTHPASAGHGLNIQFGGSIGVWYGMTWSLELYQQFIKRLHRSGQKADRVWMHHIITEGTADEDVMRACRSKGATQDDITNVVRVRLERHLYGQAA